VGEVRKRKFYVPRFVAQTKDSKGDASRSLWCRGIWPSEKAGEFGRVRKVLLDALSPLAKILTVESFVGAKRIYPYRFAAISKGEIVKANTATQLQPVHFTEFNVQCF